MTTTAQPPALTHDLGTRGRTGHALAWRAGWTLAVVIPLVFLAIFVVIAVRAINGASLPNVHWSTTPLWNPETVSAPLIAAALSIAVLSFLGFDGISTLSEEVQNPRRNILLATVITCLVTGVLASLEVYAAQLIWPTGKAFPDADTAYVHVAGEAGGWILFQVVNMTLLVATIGSGSGAQLAAARLLYGMGRDNALPKRFFGAIEPKRHIPRNNVLFTGGLALVGGFLLSYQLGAEMLNFGAFIAFMGVNLAAFVRCFVRDRKHTLGNFLPPLMGFAICFYIWINLRSTAKIAGAIWLLMGILYGAWRTRGFKSDLVKFEMPEE